MDLAHRRLTPDFTFILYVSGGGMNYVSCDICVYHLGLFVFFNGVFLSSRVTGARPMTTDLIMRVNVRTTTTAVQGGLRRGSAHARKVTQRSGDGP